MAYAHRRRWACSTAKKKGAMTTIAPWFKRTSPPQGWAS
jgi:hypothetical protein